MCGLGFFGESKLNKQMEVQIEVQAFVAMCLCMTTSRCVPSTIGPSDKQLSPSALPVNSSRPERRIFPNPPMRIVASAA